MFLVIIKNQKKKKSWERRMPEPEEAGTPTATAPNTPGTPGGPLFTGLSVDSLSYSDRKIMPKCMCLPVTAPNWGQPHTCFLDIPSPDVSLTRKVKPLYDLLFLFYFLFLDSHECHYLPCKHTHRRHPFTSPRRYLQPCVYYI